MSKKNTVISWYSIVKAYYIIGDSVLNIPGVPEYNRKYFGEYSGKYPYEAASKAFTGLQKHIKKFSDWFPEYNEEHPFEIIYVLENVENDTQTTYHGKRVPAHQGQRELINYNTGRKRIYKWDNQIVKIP